MTLAKQPVEILLKRKDRDATLTLGVHMNICHDESLKLIIQCLFGLFGLVA